MAVLRRAPATYADPEALPEIHVADRGRNGPGGWEIAFRPALHFDADVLVPDLVGFRKERVEHVPTDAAYDTTAPDWLAEVLPPPDARIDRRARMAICAIQGVRDIWLVDPFELDLGELSSLT